jgi:excinuclease ABC subunit A
MLMRKLAEAYDCPDMLTRPFRDIPEKLKHVLLFGSGDENLEFDYFIRGRKLLWSKPFEGVLANLQRRMTETESESVRERLKTYMSRRLCPACGRLNPVSGGYCRRHGNR